MIKTVFLFFSLLILNIASQSITIPKTSDGLSLGQMSSSFHLEAHYDLLCPDSRDSYFALTQVIGDYNLTSKQNFKYTIHFFPLPFHTYAHKVAIGERFVQDTYGYEKAWEYTDYIFRNQEAFYNGNISNYTLNAVGDLLGRLIERNLSIPYQPFVNSLNDPIYDQETRISWKFGCSRTVFGTPFYFVNGIKVDNAPEFQYKDWINFLQDFIDLNGTEVSSKEKIRTLRKN